MQSLTFYQNITGEKGENPERLNSYYWNEGKWKYFIDPILPTENLKDMTFMEIGCSNGLFLKLAKEKGFGNVLGFDSDLGAIERGIKYRDSLGLNYGLFCKTVGKDFNLNQLPVVDVTLLANVHYYFELKDWLSLLDSMYHRTEYCLIITRPMDEGNRHDWRPLTSIDAVKYYFKDWELVNAKYKARPGHLEPKDDPCKRTLHALLFRSKLRRRRFEELREGITADNIKIDRSGLINDVIKNIPLKETKYYQDWKARMCPKNWDENELMRFVVQKVELIKDIYQNGVREPILISGDRKVIDGKHRVAILKEFGCESVMTRMI